MARVDGAGAASSWRADRARYGRRPFLRERSIYAVAVLRFGQWSDEQTSALRLVTRLVYLALYQVVLVTTNIEIPKEVRVGPGLRIYHGGPIVVHPHVVIGAQCTMRHGVTLGERNSGGGLPVLDAAVDLGVGCVVLGPITVGKRARIGAQALVIEDVPDGAVALAPPAVVRTS